MENSRENMTESMKENTAGNVKEKEKLSIEEKSWIMYDWANSVYATIMMAAVFPIYFTNTADAAGYFGDYWWGMGTAAAMIIVALLAPLAGAMADFIGYRKKLFILFLTLGIGCTLASAFSEDWRLLLCGYALSHIGFSGSNLVYDSFLAEVTAPERMDKISGYGFAFGYIGGSTIPFLVSIALITFGESFGIDGVLAVKLSILLTALWWGAFSVPFLKNVHQRHGTEKPRNRAVFRAAFYSVRHAAEGIMGNRKIFFFILAYFFYIDGVGTVINMSTSYGAALGLDATGMILALLVTQFVAFPCSIRFASLTRSFGALRMIRGAVGVYLLICVTGFCMGFGLEEGYFGAETALVLFWILAVMVGMVQGGIQAVSRSYYCRMIPPERSGEFFGFFDIFGKFASVIGPLLYAAVKGFTGRSSLSILSIVLLFLVSFVFLRKCAETDGGHGRK